MIITRHREKLIHSIIYFARHTKYCGKTKLMKLLYFLDFSHFKQTGKSVTGLDYFAWEMGPVPKAVYEELGNMKHDMKAAISIVTSGPLQKIVPKKEYDPELFTKRELRLLEQIAFVFVETKADQMVEVAHLHNEPWDKTIKEKGELQKIDYILAIDDTKESLSLEDARDRLEEICEMHRLFGVA